MLPILWGRSLAGKKGFRYMAQVFRGSGKVSFWCTMAQVAFLQPILNPPACGTCWLYGTIIPDIQGTQGTEPLTMGLPHMTKPEGGDTISRQRMEHPFPSAEQDEDFRGPHRRQAAVL